MKDRTREAVFNLVGPDVRTMFAWDLFAGTGALGIEAVSRGAVGALLIEQHIPSYKIIRDNVQALNLEGKVRYVQSDVFHWVASHHDPAATVGIPPETPWLVFCSPPYAFFHEREEAMQKMLVTLRDRAPAGSALVVESEAPFDFETFWPDDWDVRSYPPALVGLWHKPTESETAEI
jgi:16S rRNA (guanine966-N2)-methyltransferase